MKTSQSPLIRESSARSRPDATVEHRSSAGSAGHPLHVNIISWDSGGLGTDIELLTQALTRAGCEVWFKGRRSRRPHHRLHGLFMTARSVFVQRWAELTGRRQFDVNLFIESVFPEHIATARVNCLFVHPEWFRDANLPHLHRLDFLLCKTPSGVDAMRGLPVACRELGFTSPDKRIERFVRRGPLRCLHLSGQSAVKGTEAVVAAWSRHPEWPHLTVVRRSRRYGGEQAPPLPALPNVHCEADYVPEDRLRELQNECEVHVIPSQGEAYGHVLGEAMSCGAVVVTTDAAPMNELVTSDRGLLIRVAHSEPMHRSRKHFVDVDDLEAQLTLLFEMSSERRAALGRQARSWFEMQHKRFEGALEVFLNEIRSATNRRIGPGS